MKTLEKWDHLEIETKGKSVRYFNIPGDVNATLLDICNRISTSSNFFDGLPVNRDNLIEDIKKIIEENTSE